MTETRGERIRRGEALFGQIRDYVRRNSIWTENVRIGVPTHPDPDQERGVPWTNPKDPEIRLHPDDYDAIQAWSESRGTYEGEVG